MVVGLVGRRTSAPTLSFEAWYQQVALDVTKRVVAVVGDPAIGREATAEAFARAYERWNRVGTMEAPDAWVCTTAINLCKRSWRRAAFEKRALARSPEPEQIRPVDRHDDDLVVAGNRPEDVTAAVRDLPPRMAEAIRLRYWEELPEAEVAQRMGIAPGTASALLHKARRNLEISMAPNQRGGHRQREAGRNHR